MCFQIITTSHLTSPQHVETWHFFLYLWNTYASTFRESRAKGIISEKELANEQSSYTWPKQHESNCHLHVLPHSHLSFLASPYTELRTHVRQVKHPYIHSPTIIKIIPQPHLKIQPPQGQVNSSQPQRVVSLHQGHPAGTLTSYMTSPFQRRHPASDITLVDFVEPAVVWLWMLKTVGMADSSQRTGCKSFDFFYPSLISSLVGLICPSGHKGLFSIFFMGPLTELDLAKWEYDYQCRIVNSDVNISTLLHLRGWLYFRS